MRRETAAFDRSCRSPPARLPPAFPMWADNLGAADVGNAGGRRAGDGGQGGKKLRFLRRIPYDPMTRSTDWGMRSTRDTPTSKSWGGQNVFDVYTKFEGTALDGTSYRDDW